MRKQQKLFMNENKGSSLVEVLVALLVMGITFVPLFISMSTAVKANSTSESIMYADNVASRCAEVLKSAKTYGNITDAFKNAGVDAADITTTTSGLTIKNLKEGTKQYTATITLDNSSTLNDASSYQSVGSVSGAWIPLTADCDYKALRYFSGQLKNSVVKKPVEIAKYLTKKEIKIDFHETVPGSEEADEGKYELCPTIVYEVADDSGDSVEFYTSTFSENLAAMYFDYVPEGVLIFTSPVTTLDGMNVGGTSMSESLYNYCQSKDNTLAVRATYPVNSGLSQKVTITSTVDDLKSDMITPSSEIECFCFLSGAEMNTTYSSKLKVEVASSDATVGLKVYSPTVIEKEGTGIFTSTNELTRTATDDEINKIYDVTIKIKNDTTGAIEAQMDSTVIYRD